MIATNLSPLVDIVESVQMSLFLYRVVTGWESSDWDWGSLMTSWLWHDWCLGIFLWKCTEFLGAVVKPRMRRLCKSPFSSILDLSHKSFGNRGTLMLDDYNVSPIPLLLLLAQRVDMDECIMMIKYQWMYPGDRYYQIQSNGFILMNTPRRVDIEISTFSGQYQGI